MREEDEIKCAIIAAIFTLLVLLFLFFYAVFGTRCAGGEVG